MSAHGTRTIYGSLERTLLKNGQKFVMVPDESYAKHAKAYEDAGWKRVSRAEASQQAAPKTEAAAPVWHTKLPEAGAPSKAKNGKPDDSRDVIARIAQEAADAITRTQEMNGGKLYAYVLPSTATEHGALRLLPEDQKPPAPWQMAASDGLSAGSMTKEQLTAKLREILQSQPVLASGDNKAKPAERAKPAYAYTPASKIDSPTQGVLANAMARKGEAFARLRAVRAGVKNGTANRLDLLKAESAHKEEVQAVDAAQQQLERDANQMGLTTRRDQQGAAPEAEDAALKFSRGDGRFTAMAVPQQTVAWPGFVAGRLAGACQPATGVLRRSA